MAPVRAVLRAWPLWLLLWVLTLAFALVVVLPITAVLHANLGNSLYAAHLFDNFDPQWIAEFLFQTGRSPIVALPPLAASPALAFLLLMTFLSGGVLSVFSGTAPFWPGCARNFGRLTLLLLLSLVCYGLALAANAPLEALGSKLWGDGMEERPLVLFAWCRTAFVLLLVLAVNLVFDYAKIRAVADDVRSPLRAAAGAVTFVLRHPKRTIGTYAIIALFAIALAAVYQAFSSLLPRSSLFTLLLLLVLQQAYVAARLFTRLLFFAAQTALYRSH